jgi:hypothetical protein
MLTLFAGKSTILKEKLAEPLDARTLTCTIPPVTAARIFGQNPARSPGYESHSSCSPHQPASAEGCKPSL